jgi:hypothetical protein
MIDYVRFGERSTLADLMKIGGKLIAIVAAGLVAAALTRIDPLGPVQSVGVEAVRAIASAARIERSGRLMEHPLLY